MSLYKKSKCMRVKKYNNLYNFTSLCYSGFRQGILIDYNMPFSISTLVSSIDLHTAEDNHNMLRLARDKLKIKT